MTSFFAPGECPDRAYRNVRDAEGGSLVEGRELTELLWTQFEGLADKHFLREARSNFIERFWEMYLGVALLQRGFDILPGTGSGPEFSFDRGGQKFWVEAVAPGPGTGADRVPEIELGIAYTVPTEKILLRFANAVTEKRVRYLSAVDAGIVRPDSGYILAINCRRIPHAPFGNTLPFYIQALLPIGDATVAINRATRKIEERFYARRDKVLEENNSPVTMEPFLDPAYTFISAVLHSAVDCVNRPERLGDDFSVLHNPLALHPLEASTFNWCDQYFYRHDTVEKHPATRQSKLDGTGLSG